ncbi:MAG: class III signal peptide-containing protein [Candidatus Micrarchaeota archaeon]
MELKKKKGQGAFEYILILAGVLFIVVLAILLLQSVNQGGSTQTQMIACTATLTQSPGCYGTDGNWKLATEYGAVRPASQACKNLPESIAYNVGVDASACLDRPGHQNFLAGAGVTDPSQAGGWCCGQDPSMG